MYSGQTGRFELRRYPRVGQQGLDLGTEDQPVVGPVQVQRLDTEAVSGEDQTLPAIVPDGERKHTAQVFHTTPSVLLVQMDDCLRIAMGPEIVPPRLQAAAQLSIVVDFAVEHDADGVVFVADRLLAGVQVDNAETAHGQPDVSGNEETVVIGPAVTNALVHSFDHGSIDRVGGIEVVHAANPAHWPQPCQVQWSPQASGAAWRSRPCCT